MILLPTLGIGGTLLLLAGINGVLGLTMLSAERQPGRFGRVTIGGAIVGLGSLATVLWVPRLPEARLDDFLGPRERVTAIREGVTGTVWVSEDSWHRKALWVNTSVMGRTQIPGSLSAQRIQGHIPLLLHRGTPRSVLGIGFGTGQTFGAQLLYPIERLDVVDISRAVVELAVAQFQDHLGGFDNDPRASVILEDGRDYVARTEKTYDVITLEMPPHMETGIVHFYTVDFYTMLRERLRADGIVAQWVPIYNLTLEETRGVVRTFLEVFPDAALWYNATNWLLLGGPGRFAVEPAAVKRRLEEPAVFQDLAVSYLGDPETSLQGLDGILAGFMMGPRALEGFAREGLIFTDDLPVLEFSWIDFPIWGEERKDRLVLANAEGITDILEDIEPYLTTPLDTTTMDRIRSLRRRYIGHLFALAYDNLASRTAAQGRIAEAFDLYDAAIRAGPGYAQAYYNRGNLHLRLGQVEQAIPLLQEAASLAPDLAEARFTLGLAHARIGRFVEAMSGLQEAIAIRPDFESAYLELARIQHHLGDVESAVATIQALLRQDPQNAHGLRLLRQLRE